LHVVVFFPRHLIRRAEEKQRRSHQSFVAEARSSAHREEVGLTGQGAAGAIRVAGPMREKVYAYIKAKKKSGALTRLRWHECRAEALP
jgi:hypothetical protein